MNALSCSTAGCTVSQTGVCLLNNSVEACPHVVRVGEVAGEHEDPLNASAPVLDSPLERPRFPPSAALGSDDVTELRAQAYGNLIGILGAPDSGKTACLVSMYLLLASDRLSQFAFADSQSLLVFDELSRGARAWSPAMPEQMTVHTELSSSRAAGFLHLQLRRRSDGKIFTLFVPDLPGEWSTSLVDSNENERFSFLRGASAIWFMIDGRSLLDRKRRHNAIHRLTLLIDRTLELLGTSIPALHLVVTWLDQGSAPDAAVNKITEHCRKRGVTLYVSGIASFSGVPVTRPGAGISELLDRTLSGPKKNEVFWPDQMSQTQPTRRVLSVSLEALHGRD